MKANSAWFQQLLWRKELELGVNVCSWWSIGRVLVLYFLALSFLFTCSVCCFLLTALPRSARTLCHTDL